jgi:3-oxoacyl-(acyl-carrier-protein) synthase
MRAISRRNDDPEGASRPFDLDRDGFVMAEGGGVLILEDLEFARARGAEPLAEVLAYAATSDAIHVTAPDAEGLGAARCMTLAIQRAGLEPEQISYINAHGTSTPAGDPAEVQAIKWALGEHAYRVPVSSTKSMTGHLAGGAGSLEAAICVQAIRTGTIPPTINLRTPDPACDLDFVPNQAREADLDVVLSNSFGFGGHNATLVFRAIS